MSVGILGPGTETPRATGHPALIVSGVTRPHCQGAGNSRIAHLFDTSRCATSAKRIPRNRFLRLPEFRPSRSVPCPQTLEQLVRKISVPASGLRAGRHALTRRELGSEDEKPILRGNGDTPPALQAQQSQPTAGGCACGRAEFRLPAKRRL
jgi:hypothetical protein